jgi:hypothetical protein
MAGRTERPEMGTTEVPEKARRRGSTKEDRLVITARQR